MSAPQAFDGIEPRPPADAFERPFGAGDLPALRQELASLAWRWSLPPSAGADLLLVVNELATNSLRHGGGSGYLWVWRDHEDVVFEVADADHLTAPLPGGRHPDTAAISGRGLYLVSQLCRDVQVRSRSGVTAVRARLAATTGRASSPPGGSS